jgi:hypothetical protein
VRIACRLAFECCLLQRNPHKPTDTTQTHVLSLLIPKRDSPKLNTVIQIQIFDLRGGFRLKRAVLDRLKDGFRLKGAVLDRLKDGFRLKRAVLDRLKDFFDLRNSNLDRLKEF